jgi:hypothetical protein
MGPFILRLRACHASYESCARLVIVDGRLSLRTVPRRPTTGALETAVGKQTILVFRQQIVYYEAARGKR